MNRWTTAAALVAIDNELLEDQTPSVEDLFVIDVESRMRSLLKEWAEQEGEPSPPSDRTGISEFIFKENTTVFRIDQLIDLQALQSRDMTIEMYVALAGAKARTVFDVYRSGYQHGFRANDH